MSDLEDRPSHFVLLLALMTGIFGIFHLVLELEQSIFDVFEAIWRRLSVLGCADGRHSGGFESPSRCLRYDRAWLDTIRCARFLSRELTLVDVYNVGGH